MTSPVISRARTGPQSANVGDAFWRVFDGGRSAIPARQGYWWDNGARTRRNVIAQLTIGGSLPLQSPGRERLADPGTLLLMRTGQPLIYGWRSIPHTPYDSWWIELSGAGLSEHWQSLEGTYGDLIRVDAVTARGLALEIGRLGALGRRQQRPHPFDEAAGVHALVLRIAAACSAGGDAPRAAGDRAVDALLAAPHEAASIKSLAASFGISREHLTRRFQERTGDEPGRWLAMRRLALARVLLRETDGDAAMIASRCGYASRHHLARCLRRSDGMGPREFRKG